MIGTMCRTGAFVTCFRQTGDIYVLVLAVRNETRTQGCPLELVSPARVTAIIGFMDQNQTRIVELLREVHLIALTEIERLNLRIVELENQRHQSPERTFRSRWRQSEPSVQRARVDLRVVRTKREKIPRGEVSDKSVVRRSIHHDWLPAEGPPPAHLVDSDPAGLSAVSIGDWKKRPLQAFRRPRPVSFHPCLSQNTRQSLWRNIRDTYPETFPPRHRAPACPSVGDPDHLPVASVCLVWHTRQRRAASLHFRLNQYGPA